MPWFKQKKATKAAIKRLIIGVTPKAIYIYFKVTDKTNNNNIIVITLDLYS